MALLRGVCEGSRAWGTCWTVAEGLKAGTTHHSISRGGRSCGRLPACPVAASAGALLIWGLERPLRGSSVSGRDGGSLEAVSSHVGAVRAFAPHGPARVSSFSWPQIQRQEAEQGSLQAGAGGGESTRVLRLAQGRPGERWSGESQLLDRSWPWGRRGGPGVLAQPRVCGSEPG